MEINLSVSSSTRAIVHCNGECSHDFEISNLIPDEKVQNRPPQPYTDAVMYGKAVFTALFPQGSLALTRLNEGPERILLITTDERLQPIPWEYAYGMNEFLVLKQPFVRGLAAQYRIEPPTLSEFLHVVVIPSNPIDKHVDPIQIGVEWQRIREVVQGISSRMTIERTRPPTLEQLRKLLIQKQGRIVHFIGHGGEVNGQKVLFFENEQGGLRPTSALDLIRRIGKSAFFVSLNACLSAAAGENGFGNIAYSLVQNKVPYALGMNMVIPDTDALVFSHTLFEELARGSTVEDAIWQGRLKLAESEYQWVVGVPVLYTC